MSVPRRRRPNPVAGGDPGRRAKACPGPAEGLLDRVRPCRCMPGSSLAAPRVTRWHDGGVFHCLRWVGHGPDSSKRLPSEPRATAGMRSPLVGSR